MAEENFDFGMLEGGGENDAGASLNESESSDQGMIDEASTNETRSQPQSSPAAESEEYTVRERALLDRIEKLTGQSYEGQRNQQTDVTSFQAQEHNFLDGLDIDEVLSSGENLNKLLLAVYNRGLEQSTRMAQESWQAAVPNVVREHVTQHMTMRELVDNFYAENSDLVNVRKTVGAIANEISQENPNLTLDEVFAEAAKRTRETLGLSAQGNTQQQNVPKPNLPTRRQPGNRRNGTNQLTGVAKEIDDLLS